MRNSSNLYDQKEGDGASFSLTFQEAIASPVSSYVDVQNVDGDDLDILQTKIMLDYKQGRYRQASKRYKNLLETLGFDEGKALIDQVELLGKTSASLLVFELLFILKKNGDLTEEQLWKYVDSVSLFDPDDVVFHGVIYNLMLVFFLRNGDVNAALELAKMALEAYGRGQTVYLEMFIHLHIAYIHIYAGRLSAADQALNDAHEKLMQCGAPACENALIEITRHWVRAETDNQLPDPKVLANLGRDITSGEFWPETFLVLAALQFRVAVAQGKLPALEQLGGFEFTLRSRGMVHLLPAMQLLREEYLLSEKSVKTGGKPLGLPERQMILLLPSVRSWCLNVGEACEYTPKFDRIRALDEMHQARIWRKRGRFDLAMDHFTIAMEIIITQGWKYFLASEYDFIAEMCRECRQRRRFVEQARDWQNSLLVCRPEVPTRIVPAPMGLTASEVGILRRLPDITSNKALALDLGVTESTVKYHLKNIYRKLSVHSRLDAIRVATNKGIIG